MKKQMSFGENLINLRKQKGWSQDDLADNLNLSRQAISKWENNTSKPDIDNIKKISKVFSVGIDDLLNNDVAKDKAVALNVKKEEKKERTITIVKCMIIAVIILYIISVIYKFSSLLIIVNGIQKYANLSNYHYVITTYDENGLVEKEECWFKDGVSKTIIKKYENNTLIHDVSTNVDYLHKKGYIIDNMLEEKKELDVENYINSHKNYFYGGQLYSKFPVNILSNNFMNILFKSLYPNKLKIQYKNEKLYFIYQNDYIVLNSDNLLPFSYYTIKQKENKIINYYYKVELNAVNSLEI